MPDYVKMADEVRAGSLEGTLSGLAGFDGYYDHELKPILEGLEAERPQALKNFYMFVAGAIMLFVLAAFFILLRGRGDPGVLIFVGMASIGICYWGFRPLAALRKKAKLAVMHHLCDYLGLDYHMKPFQVSLTQHRELSLIPSHDESKVEDQISGDVEGVGFDLFEAKLVTISRDSKGRKTRTTVFRGLLAKFDFHKNFTGTTIITRDYSKLGNFFGGWGKPGERVKLEDPVFEGLFEVYSTDQIEARYLLTPRFMERVCYLSNRVGRGNMQLAFHHGDLYLAIRKKKDSFEGGSAFSDFTDQANIKQTITEVALIYDIVQKLKLDMDSRI